MRYIVLVLIGSLSVVVSGSLITGIDLAGMQLDLVLLITVSLALIEKTSMPIVFAALTGLFMDILFSTVLGVYAISYTVTTATVFFLFRHSTRFNFLFLFAAGAGAYLVKEVMMGVVVYALGARFDFLSLLARYTLPSALLAGGLIFPAYWLLSRLMKRNLMRPRKSYLSDEF